MSARVADRPRRAAPGGASGAPRARPCVLVVDDERAVRDLLVALLEDEGYEVETAARGDEALRLLGGRPYDLVLLDVQLPGPDGISVLAAGRALQGDAQFLVMTGHASVDAAVEAMRLGAFDYVRKPFHVADLLALCERALAERALRRAAAPGTREAPRPDGGGARVGAVERVRERLVGRSPAMERLFALVQRVAPMKATVLVTGETGTGKELVARAVHDLSPRAAGPFVAVNCSALAETLLESELFGHVKGAFTGAIADRRGLIEAAHGGTLFLDEIATISPALQVKLLRVLQERAVQRVGGGRPTPVDFRLVAAANVELADEVAAGRFREDLYYRLSVVPVAVPPLRHRPDDVPLLAAHFRARFAEENGVEEGALPALGAEALRAMQRFAWPGNVRQLQNVVERLLILHAGAPTVVFEPPPDALAPAAGGDDAPPEPAPSPRPPGAAPAIEPLLAAALARGWSLERLEREYVLAAYAALVGRRERTARLLGIDRRTLYRKLRQYGVASASADPDAFPDEAGAQEG